MNFFLILTQGHAHWFEGGREGNIDQLPPIFNPTGDQTHNLGRYLDQELNLKAFGLQDNAPTNWAKPAKVHCGECFWKNISLRLWLYP